MRARLFLFREDDARFVHEMAVLFSAAAATALGFFGASWGALVIVIALVFVLTRFKAVELCGTTLVIDEREIPLVELRRRGWFFSARGFHFFCDKEARRLLEAVRAQGPYR